MISTTSLFIGIRTGKEKVFSEIIETESLISIKEEDEFSKDKFIEMLKDLNVTFPHIVMAQSIIETGNWRSNIFIENHNLFGMKEAKRRVTTAVGTHNNHAYYNHWRESVYDYAFFQCRYLYKIKSEDEYFKYLSANYAEDTLYVPKVKNIINRDKLKDFF
jgi:flagellum-specific peptidoglycan hydrolase FlgJ